MIASRLDQALRDAGIPISGVSIGDPANRRTWIVRYAPEATSEQIDAGTALVADFVPDAPEAKEAETVRAARVFADQLYAQASSRFLFYRLQGEDATYDDKASAADRALWERCFKEAAG